MGWSLGEHNGRDIGYGVVAFCDHPGCGAEIDRGLGHACGGEHGPTETSCGLYFCGEHGGGIQCERCAEFADEMEESELEFDEDGDPVLPDFEPFEPTFDHPLWIAFKLRHESWQKWRDENPMLVAELREKYSMTLELTKDLKIE